MKTLSLEGSIVSKTVTSEEEPSAVIGLTAKSKALLRMTREPLDTQCYVSLKGSGYDT